MVNSKIIVSIIVPVYNVAQYLDRCIDSILSQTHTSIEVILVDDGSTDEESSIICDRFARLDKRVRTIHKINGGLSDARNAGIKVSTGKYLSFVDGDDYIDSTFIEKMLNAAEREGADISVCSYAKVYGEKCVAAKKTSDNEIFSNEDALRDLFKHPSLSEVMTWNKLYKRVLFSENNLFFPVGKLHEDNFTTYKAFYYSKKIVFINEVLYFYVQREGSIMGGQFRNSSKDILQAGDEILDFINKNANNLANDAAKYRISLYIYYLNLYADSGCKERDYWLSAVQGIGDVGDNPEISTTHKLLIKVARLGCMPYRILRKMYNLKAGV